MEAMDYEYLLRRAYQCGRGEVLGANADYYRQMEHSARTYVLDLENI